MIVATLIIFAAAALFFILKGKKKSQAPLDPAQIKQLANLLEDHVAFYRDLGNEDKITFVEKVQNFLHRVHIEGVGFGIDDLDRVLVASSAIIPVFKFSDWEYRNLTSVILYPDTFDHDFQFQGEGRSVLGMVGTGFMHGQMALSRSALRKGFMNDADGRNTAIHEFVHLLDMADGDADGLPELMLPDTSYSPWIKAIQQEMRRIEKGKSDIDPYGLTNDAEFLAVASEYFFEKPEKMKKRYPELYAFMEKMYNPA